VLDVVSILERFTFYARLVTRASSLRKNTTKRGESFFQGLKPIGSTQFTSALKHRPPEEKDFAAPC